MDEKITRKTGKLYSVGCLPLLPLIPLLLLVDLICKAIVWGIASLFGVQIPALAIAIKWMAYVIFIPLRAIFIATLIWMLYAFISERIGNLFRKGKKDKDDKKGKEPPTETSPTEIDS